MSTQGTIKSIVRKGGYDSRNGYICTFDMAIDTQQGLVEGEIGAKSEIYPLAAGQPIVVDVTDDAHGRKLKKVNPQYAGQSGSTPPLGNQAPPQAAQGPDWDKIADGKVKCNVVCSAIQSGQFVCKTLQDVQKYTDFIMGRDAQPQTQAGPADWENAPADDDIPF